MPSHRRRKIKVFGAAAGRRLAHSPTAQTIRHRGIYLLPNAFTTAALFCGFYAIVQAMNARFEIAAIAIFFAMVLDGMDGRVARLTHTQSAFGEQYDSLSDMTSFGVAPALVMYEWVLSSLGRWGWMAAFVYVAGAALRLARFNTNIEAVDKRFFQGLPSPASAALIAGFVWLAIDNKLPISDPWMPWSAFALTVYAGVTMVSNAPFFSGKSFALGRSVPFWMMLLVVFGFVFVSTDPPIVLFSLFVAYGLSGYVMWLVQWWRNKPGRGNRIVNARSDRSSAKTRSMPSATPQGGKTSATTDYSLSKAQTDAAPGDSYSSHSGGMQRSPARSSTYDPHTAPQHSRRDQRLHTSATTLSTSYSHHGRHRPAVEPEAAALSKALRQSEPSTHSLSRDNSTTARQSAESLHSPMIKGARNVLRSVLGRSANTDSPHSPHDTMLSKKREPGLTPYESGQDNQHSPDFSVEASPADPSVHGSIGGVYRQQQRFNPQPEEH